MSSSSHVTVCLWSTVAWSVLPSPHYVFNHPAQSDSSSQSPPLQPYPFPSHAMQTFCTDYLSLLFHPIYDSISPFVSIIFLIHVSRSLTHLCTHQCQIHPHLVWCWSIHQHLYSKFTWSTKNHGLARGWITPRINFFLFFKKNPD